MNKVAAATTTDSPGVYVTRVELSIGAVDLFRFANHQHAFPRHSHERLTVGVFGERNGSIQFRSGTRRGESGAILAIGQDEPHSAEPERGSGWTYRTFYPSSAVLNHALGTQRTENVVRLRQPVINDADFGTRLANLHVQLEQSPVTLQSEIQLLEALRHLIEKHGAQHRQSPGTEVSTTAVLRVREFLEENFARNITLAELSSVAGLSPFHLVRSFRDAIGVPPHAYLTQTRANRARDFLLNGEAVSMTAYRCGFSDQSHLTRTFKKLFGITPGAYANCVRG